MDRRKRRDKPPTAFEPIAEAGLLFAAYKACIASRERPAGGEARGVNEPDKAAVMSYGPQAAQVIARPFPQNGRFTSSPTQKYVNSTRVPILPLIIST